MDNPVGIAINPLTCNVRGWCIEAICKLLSDHALSSSVETIICGSICGDVLRSRSETSRDSLFFSDSFSCSKSCSDEHVMPEVICGNVIILGKTSCSSVTESEVIVIVETYMRTKYAYVQTNKLTNRHTHAHTRACTVSYTHTHARTHACIHSTHMQTLAHKIHTQ